MIVPLSQCRQSLSTNVSWLLNAQLNLNFFLILCALNNMNLYLFSGVLPCAPPFGATYDQCNAAPGLHPQCDHRAEEISCGSS